MLLRLPRGLHYPITVKEVLKWAGFGVVRDEPLFVYTYETTVREGSRDGEDRFVKKIFTAQFNSNLEGHLKCWMVWKGDVIYRP
jgi:RNA polymerase II subunit A C-terminal domain phosphatase